MRLKFYLRGAGIGVVVTTIVLAIIFAMNPKSITDDEIKQRAKQLGMMEASEVEKMISKEAADTSTASKTDDYDTPDTKADPDTTVDEKSEGAQNTDSTDDKQDAADADAEKTDTEKIDTEKTDTEKTDTDKSEDAAKSVEEDKTEKTEDKEKKESTDKKENTEKKDNTDKKDNTEKNDNADKKDSTDKKDTEEKKDTTDNTQKPAETVKPDTAETAEKPAQSNGESRTIKIHSGNVSSTVAGYLYKAGLVESASDFDNYIQTVKKDRVIMCGTFDIPVGSTYDEIINIITKEKR